VREGGSDLQGLVPVHSAVVVGDTLGAAVVGTTLETDAHLDSLSAPVGEQGQAAAREDRGLQPVLAQLGHQVGRHAANLLDVDVVPVRLGVREGGREGVQICGVRE